MIEGQAAPRLFKSSTAVLQICTVSKSSVWAAESDKGILDLLSSPSTAVVLQSSQFFKGLPCETIITDFQKNGCFGK